MVGIRFLRKIEGVTLLDTVRSFEIRKTRNIEPLLLRIKRSQLRYFVHVSRIPYKRPVGRPRTRWTNYMEDLKMNRLGLHPSDVMEDGEMWRLNLKLQLLLQPSRKSGS